MKKWDGTVLDINATCTELWPKCFQLLSVHATLPLSGNFPDLADVIGEIGISSSDLMQAINPFVTALYDQVPGMSIGDNKIQPFH